MNPDLSNLNPYPFERIRVLLQDLSAPDVPAVSLSVGEPRHEPPEFVLQALTDTWRTFGHYPSTRGGDPLRQAIARWLEQRFRLGPDAIASDSQVLTVNGTREALFSVAQCVLDRTARKRMVLCPNPFYQIYEGAIYLAGLKPTFYTASSDNSLQPVFPTPDDPVWEQVQMLYLCNPGNPTGSVLPLSSLQELVSLADKHGFTIVSDECYSEIYRHEENPPPGLLEAAWTMGNTDFRHCLVFHSLSKRSNLPGMRSGFVAGDAGLLNQFLLYRTYHGCSMPPPVQHASTLAWQDEAHVKRNRLLYNAKYEAVVPILSEVLAVSAPEAGFYLWPDLGLDDESFARDMFRLYNLAVVPGSYLARDMEGINPAKGRARLALVAEQGDCVEAAEKIRDYYQNHRVADSS